MRKLHFGQPKNQFSVRKFKSSGTPPQENASDASDARLTTFRRSATAKLRRVRKPRRLDQRAWVAQEPCPSRPTGTPTNHRGKKGNKEMSVIGRKKSTPEDSTENWHVPLDDQSTEVFQVSAPKTHFWDIAGTFFEVDFADFGISGPWTKRNNTSFHACATSSM